MIASETANHGAIFVTFGLACVGLLVALFASRMAGVRVMRSKPHDFAVGSKAVWLPVVVSGPAIGAVVWFLMLGHVGSSSFTYASDDQPFWTWAAPLMIFAGTTGAATWYMVDCRRRRPER